MVAGGRLLISCRKTAAGSNPALSAKIYWVVGKLVCHGTVNAPEIAGSSPAFPAKSLTERAYFPPVVQVVTLTGCRLDG